MVRRRGFLEDALGLVCTAVVDDAGGIARIRDKERDDGQQQSDDDGRADDVPDMDEQQHAPPHRHAVHGTDNEVIRDHRQPACRTSRTDDGPEIVVVNGRAHPHAPRGGN